MRPETIVPLAARSQRTTVLVLLVVALLGALPLVRPLQAFSRLRSLASDTLGRRCE